MGLPARLLAGGVVAGLALAAYVYDRRARTGADVLTVLRQLPADLRRLRDEAQRRAVRALEEGCEAARRREAELVRQLEAAGPRREP